MSCKPPQLSIRVGWEHAPTLQLSEFSQTAHQCTLMARGFLWDIWVDRVVKSWFFPFISTVTHFCAFDSKPETTEMGHIMTEVREAKQREKKEKKIQSSLTWRCSPMWDALRTNLLADWLAGLSVNCVLMWNIWNASAVTWSMSTTNQRSPAEPPRTSSLPIPPEETSIQWYEIRQESKCTILQCDDYTEQEVCFNNCNMKHTQKMSHINLNCNQSAQIKQWGEGDWQTSLLFYVSSLSWHRCLLLRCFKILCMRSERTL